MVRPRAVVDVGCGGGTWLSVAKELGAEKVVGFEGEWAAKAGLTFPGLDLRIANLEQPLPEAERFDLAISLEVAEHLSPSRAGSFVEDLCRMSDVVLFGAAIPGQRGTNHINEQWQSYWAELFEQRGYRCFDVIRPRVWDNDDVEFWYRQNALLYVAPARVGEVEQQVTRAAMPLDVIHPQTRKLQPGLRDTVTGVLSNAALVPGALARAVRRRVAKHGGR